MTVLLKTYAEICNCVGQETKEPEILRTDLNLPQALGVEKTENWQAVNYKFEWAASRNEMTQSWTGTN